MNSFRLIERDPVVHKLFVSVGLDRSENYMFFMPVDRIAALMRDAVFFVRRHTRDDIGIDEKLTVLIHPEVLVGNADFDIRVPETVIGRIERLSPVTDLIAARVMRVQLLYDILSDSLLVELVAVIAAGGDIHFDPVIRREFKGSSERIVFFSPLGHQVHDLILIDI